LAIKHDLRNYIELLVQQEPVISEVYLFGSRAYGTGSLRSDCDLIVHSDPNRPTKSSSLRTFAIEHCLALDFFLCTEARATSAANDSSVHAADFTSLVDKLDATPLWTRAGGFVDFAFRDTGDWTFDVAEGVDFKMTTMPESVWADMVWSTKQKAVEDRGLPVQPYIGDTLDKAVGQIADVIRRMAFKSSDLGQKGHAKTGWTVNLASEYDCQNLFFTVVKPWLPSLGREEVAVRYDGQSKQSDFSLFDGKLIIEMKFIDSTGKKGEVVKTLAGLSSFYAQNANVGALLFVIFVTHDVAVDEPKWESDFSFETHRPFVKTLVVRLPQRTT
jgi:predicted nucleotidyltransferase